MTKFTHHTRWDLPSDDPWKFDSNRLYTQQEESKPSGFWLGVDDDWKRWCEGAELDWADTPAIEFEVATEQCLWLKTPEDMKQFTAKFAVDYNFGFLINWIEVSDQYSGIIISPCHSVRSIGGSIPDNLWYWGWDAASACIWDLSALRVK